MGNKNSYNVICFGYQPWSKMWKRNQSMMAELAKLEFINRVTFVNPICSVLSLLRIKNSITKSKAGIKNVFITTRISPKIFIYTPKNFIPQRRYLSSLRAFETRIITRIGLKKVQRLNSDKPYILFLNSPNIFLHDLVDFLLEGASLSIFDFSDDFLELGYNKKTLENFRRNIELYTPAVDMVLTANEHIRLKYRKLNPNIHVIRNATNYDNFDRKCYKPVDRLEKLKNNKHPIIGYSGTVNMSRLDAGILDFTIKQRPNWNFVFIGYAKNEFSQKYLHYKNVHHIEPVDYVYLPNYLQYFDVAIVPFQINAHTRGNDLLKFHDYLAMGKPVVSTETAGANDLKGVIKIANSPSTFLDEIERSLSTETSDVFLDRKQIAKQNSWGNRIKEFEQLLMNYLEI